jgi:hypothetical protein
VTTKGRPTHQCRAKVAAKAGQSLRMPSKPPPCFPARQKEWDQYRATCNYTADKRFTFCRDCTPERKAEMVTQRRCQYPKTVFIMSYGVLVGRRQGAKSSRS